MSFLTRSRRLPVPQRTATEDHLTTNGRAEHTPSDDATADGAGAARDENVAREPAGERHRARRVAAWVTTALACLFVLFALVAPAEFDRLTPAAFVRIPLEGLLGVALVLALPATPRRVVATLIGVGLGLLTIVKIIDMGFFAVLARPFDPVLDWTLFDDALSFLTDSIGRVGAIGSVIAIALLVVGVLVLMTRSVLRLTRIVVRHDTAATRTVTALVAAWVACAVLGVQLAPGAPVAASSATSLVYDRALQVREGLHDKQAFAEQAAVDRFRDTPGDQLLTALRGKDVVFCWIESYGRDAIEDPAIEPQVDPVLADGNRRLDAAGYGSRSGFLTSSTAGGGSWLAHGTLLSGLWIDNGERYGKLVSSDRLTLPKAFGRANWQTVAVEPGNSQDWAEGKFYGYDRVYDSRNLGYRGPKFSWSPIPDQYTLSAFDRAEYAKPGRPAMMAEVTLTSSHGPWAPIPHMIDWADVGDGSVYGPIAKAGNSPDAVWRDPSRGRTEYGRSIAYSLDSLISYVENYGNDNLVLVFLGDHQPAPLVTGTDAGRDVPISIVAHDPAVLDRISGWGWQAGLKPDPQAPVWPMDAFRDRFLTAFGP